ncbi:MAG: tyrosine-type recombinase/integrase [Chloroflexi bacterium]|nr:tyrosine-type recombinase/integrase [Chloroflexota bacterium]
MFPSKGGDHITANCVQQLIRRLATKAGLIGVKVHPHIFRHTFATMFLGNGGQSLALKEILGHESISTTQKYVHLRPQDLQAQHNKGSIIPGGNQAWPLSVDSGGRLLERWRRLVLPDTTRVGSDGVLLGLSFNGAGPLRTDFVNGLTPGELNSTPESFLFVQDQRRMKCRQVLLLTAP